MREQICCFGIAANNGACLQIAKGRPMKKPRQSCDWRGFLYTSEAAITVA
jgi:hypothetical protein